MDVIYDDFAGVTHDYPYESLYGQIVCQNDNSFNILIENQAIA